MTTTQTRPRTPITPLMMLMMLPSRLVSPPYVLSLVSVRFIPGSTPSAKTFIIFFIISFAYLLLLYNFIEEKSRLIIVHR